MKKLVQGMILLMAMMAVGLAFGRHTVWAADAPKLVVVKAVYGDLPDGDKADVTEKVKAMVKDDTLSVDATNDNFGDPAEGATKKLQVDYKFDGADKSKTVNEGETLTVDNKGE